MGFAKWFSYVLTLVLLTSIQSGEFALKCHLCQNAPPRCQEETCANSVGYLCKTTRYNNDTDLIKGCGSEKLWDDILGASDTCRTGSGYDFEEKELRIGYFLVGGEEHEYERYIKHQLGKPEDYPKEMTVCTCSTDLCNSDDNVKELMEKDKGKMLDTGKETMSSKATRINPSMDSGNLGVVIVMFVALLEVVAALVP